MIAATPAVDLILSNDAAVAIGVSGGKDSAACAIATLEYLDRFGHRGPQVLIHSDLGRVEWRASLGECERLAKHVGRELIIVRRGAGDMMDRWLSRWSNNVDRYESLRCVKLILPWSTPDMRFCTSELKIDVICRELTHRFQGRHILSVSGIRREESSRRAKAEIVARQRKLESVTRKTKGHDWHPILEWKLESVLNLLGRKGIPLHEAYTKYGASRVSCAFCILASHADLLASSKCEDNQELYREMVDLEIRSTFHFQAGRWLGDVAPELLSEEAREALEESKRKSERREMIESWIPRHLLYTKGWPTVMPTREEAELLAYIRQEVSSLVGLESSYLDAESIIGRYDELMKIKSQKEAA